MFGYAHLRRHGFSPIKAVVVMVTGAVLLVTGVALVLTNQFGGWSAHDQLRRSLD